MKKTLSIFILLLVSGVAFSQKDFDPESLLKPGAGRQYLVSDFSGNTLTEDQKQTLEHKLLAFNDSTSNEIAVVIVPTIKENDIDDYSVKLFRAWGIGTKKNNNGVLLLIVNDVRKLRITTGYGLEGALPDITCKEIIDEIIVPQFKGNDYYRGIDEGTDAIIQAAKGVYTSPGDHGTPHKYPLFVRILFWIIGIIIIIVLLSTGWIWPLLNIATSIVFSGGGSSSGGGGGGFGGFGGGSSGGGGASGSW